MGVIYMSGNLIGFKETKEAMEFLDLLDKHGDIIFKYTDLNEHIVAELMYRVGIT